MKVTIEKDKILLNLADLLDHLDHDSKMQFIEHLSCQSDVIKRVTEQILDGHTEDWSYGPKGCTADAAPESGLDWATREVSRRSGEVAAREIKRLEEAIIHKEDELKSAWSMYRELQQQRQFA